MYNEKELSLGECFQKGFSCPSEPFMKEKWGKKYNDGDILSDEERYDFSLDQLLMSLKKNIEEYESACQSEPVKYKASLISIRMQAIWLNIRLFKEAVEKHHSFCD